MKCRIFAVAQLLLLAAVGLQASPAVFAATITPGNLVVYRVGDGSAALGTSATAVFLDEYTQTGTLVQTIPVPSSGGSQLTAIGNASTEGIISRSQDGSKLVFGGYRANTGAAPGTANRVIGSLDPGGNLDTSIAITDISSAVPRSATTVDGTAYWLGTSTSVRYVGAPGPAATSVQIDARNSRQVNLADNTLFASNGSTSVTAKVQSYGLLPTGATVPTAVVSLLTTDAVNGFTLLDLSPAVPGADTLYALSTVAGQLVKYSFDGTNWLANGSVASTALNVTAIADGSNVLLYLTTSGKLQTLTDSSGYNVAISGTVSDIAVASTNTAFRGVGLFIPEPSTMLSLLVAATVSLFFSRQRA